MSTNPDDYSPAETLITFDHPIPLLRHPTPSLDHDSFILTFTNPNSWATAYTSCDSSILQQCEAGARIGCSVAASKRCAPPWWKTLTTGNIDLIEREKCEEREMAECLEASRVKCRKFAEDKCWPAFRDARVVVRGVEDENVRKSVVEVVSRVWFGGRSVKGVDVWRLEGSWARVKARIGFGIVRGSDLLEKQV